MAIYYKGEKVSPTLNTIVTITKNQNNEVIDTEVGGTALIEDPDNLSSEAPVITEWTRPSGWPNLDALPALTEGVYCTYDNTSRADIKVASFRVTISAGDTRIAVGHVADNTWVQDTYYDVASNVIKEINYGTYAYDYIVFKIIPASSGHITQFYFAEIAQATTGMSLKLPQHRQYCIERKGRLPYLNSTRSSSDAYRYATEWLESDDVLIGESVTGNMVLGTAWYRANRLRRVVVDNWPTSQWNVTDIGALFQHCYSLEKVDLSSWNTINWHVTTCNALFDNCRQLKICIVPFNTSNWGPTNKKMDFSTMWNNCYSLYRLDLSTWDVSNINVTTLRYTWCNCYKLRSLNVKNWNTSLWTMDANNYGLQQTWYSCQTLVDIDLSNWDTSGWLIKHLGGTWQANYKRRSFKDIENWKTHNWQIISLDNTWEGCYRIESLDLSEWDTSSWAITSLYYTWSNCRNLKTLKVGTWNTSNWAVTDIRFMLGYCYSLTSVEAFNWNTSNWNIQQVSGAFYACKSVKEIDLTKWSINTTYSIPSTAAVNYITDYCSNATKIDLSRMDFSSVTAADNYGSSNSYTPFYSASLAETINLPANYAGHLDLSQNTHLSHNEIVKIIGQLKNPALSGARLVLGNNLKCKLTTAEIAVATNKGYTVS